MSIAVSREACGFSRVLSIQDLQVLELTDVSFLGQQMTVSDAIMKDIDGHEIVYEPPFQTPMSMISQISA
jgi:hypothetical protein